MLHLTLRQVNYSRLTMFVISEIEGTGRGTFINVSDMMMNGMKLT